jgi:membrane protein YdbS with pleckstrin-like domain
VWEPTSHLSNKENAMKLTPPKAITFWIAVVIGLLAFLSLFVTLPFISANAFWVMFVAWALLVLGLLVKGL